MSGSNSASYSLKVPNYLKVAKAYCTPVQMTSGWFGHQCHPYEPCNVSDCGTTTTTTYYVAAWGSSSSASSFCALVADASLNSSDCLQAIKGAPSYNVASNAPCSPRYRCQAPSAGAIQNTNNTYQQNYQQREAAAGGAVPISGGGQLGPSTGGQCVCSFTDPSTGKCLGPLAC